MRSSVQAGDRVVVKIYGEGELSGDFMVSTEADVILPRVGALSVKNLSVQMLADTVRARYARFLRNPVVDLTVLRRIVVNGEVLKPEVYYVDVVSTLRDVIARAGGISPNGDASRVEIVRHGERIRVTDWQHDETLASDLSSGDQVVVGRRSWLSLNASAVLSAAALVVSLIVTLRR